MTVEKDYNINSCVIEYTDEWYHELLVFFSEAEKLNLENNISFKAMKWDLGKWWISVDDGKIVGISGCHPLPKGKLKYGG